MIKQDVYLAIDIGASSGRAVLGFLNDGKIRIEEIHRFTNGPVQLNGTLYWNVLSMWQNIVEALRFAASKGYEHLAGIGIDTWGVDWALIGKDGKLLGNCVHYRDTRTENIEEVIAAKINNRQLYNLTGLMIGRVTSLAQMLAQKYSPGAIQFDCADKWLMIADMFRYFLSGQKACELTAAGSSALVSLKGKKWSEKIFKLFDLPLEIMPDIIKPGQISGKLQKAICEQTGIKEAQVITVAGHDTASAAAALPVIEPECGMLICGTWSVLGQVENNPVTSDKAFQNGFINEFGLDSILFVKNLMGLYLFENLRRSILQKGEEIGYDKMVAEARKAKAFAGILSVNAPMFFVADNPEEAVKSFLDKTGQNSNLKRGEIIRCLLEGLVFSYLDNFGKLLEITGKKLERICMVGGGVKNEFLCQMIADALGMEVITGTAEATIVGNLAVQALATKQLSKPEDIQKLVKDSFEFKKYEPQKGDDWMVKFSLYKEIERKSKTL